MESQKAKVKKQKFRSKVKSSKTSKPFDFLLAILTFNFCLLTFSASAAHAASASNDHFQLELEPYEETVLEEKPTPAPVSQPQTQTSPGIAFIPSPFSFAITEPLIDFGVLSATNPVTRITSLKVSSPGSGYQVFAFANHPLRSKKAISIPDTTCDNGSCSEITASLWENNLTYGFGFRCDSEIEALCSHGFEDENTFKQLPDHSKKEIIQPVIQSDTRTDDHQARITYKINISGTQQKEAYSNTVTYIAVPNF